MKHILMLTATLLSACHGVSPTQTATPTGAAAPTQEQPATAADPTPVKDSLSDLEAMTFSCPKAGLNAAAREAAKAPAQGTYQFAYFRIISDSHHSTYEVHFKSNYFGEPDLKYCVSVYCQQGWDPKTAKTSVSLISNEPPPSGSSAPVQNPIAACGDPGMPVKH